MHETNWFLGFLVLASGLALGGLLAWRFGRNAGDSITGDEGVGSDASPAARDALIARRDALMNQLRSLDASTPADVRRQLEVETAAVLRDLDSLSEPPPAVEKSSSPMKALLWVGGTVAFAVTLTLALLQFTTERAPGGSITGNTSLPGGPGEAPPVDPMIAQLEQRVMAEPENLEYRLDLAQAYVYSERTDLLINAFQQLMPVLQAEPENPRALTYVAIIRLAMGQFDQAFESLDLAVKGDPSLTEAWVQRGLAAFRLGKWEDAARSWERAVEQRPDGEQVLRPLIARAQTALENGEPPPTQAHPPSQHADPHGAQAGLPPGHPPTGSAAPHAAAPAMAATGGSAPTPGAKAISGRLELPAELASKYGKGTLVFIFARNAGAAGGPPAAVKRLTVDAFPLEFTLGEGDTMMGLPFPDRVDLEARIDADGNAMTRDPSEPAAKLVGVDAGTKGVVLRLVPHG